MFGSHRSCGIYWRRDNRGFTSCLLFNIFAAIEQKQIRVDSALYGNVILIVILASNIWSSHGQNVNPQNDDATDYVNAGGGSDVSGSNSAERDRVQSSGEVMASRLPVLNENEPSCEELKAMWRYISECLINIHSFTLICLHSHPYIRCDCSILLPSFDFYPNNYNHSQSLIPYSYKSCQDL